MATIQFERPPALYSARPWRWADNFAILVACFAPFCLTYLYSVVFAGQPGLPSFVFAAGKFVLLFLPIFWVLIAQRQTVIGVKWTWPAFNFGMLVGMVMFVSILVFYVLFCRGASAIAAMPTRMRDFLDDFGIITPPLFIVMAIGLSFINSAVEEYYWRWFVFGQLRRVMSLPPACLLGAGCFTLHHIILVSNFVDPRTRTVGIVVGSLAVFVAGVIWNLMLEYSKNVTAGWFAHILADLAIMMVGYDLIFNY